MGLFDGHGLYGHKISSFVMSHMADFVKHSKYFNEKNLYYMSDGEVKKAMRKCFRFAQDKAKEQFREFLKKKKRKQRRQNSIDKLSTLKLNR